MSTKIRCVKPEFYRHLGLYQLEQRTRLPIRISFEGLWAVADREGRFRWRAHDIKLDVLPYDEVDFAVILEELARAKFIVQYVVDGEAYGFIPTWKKHQRLNNREKPSQIPAPPECGDNSPVQLELNPSTPGEVSTHVSDPLQMQSRSGSGSGGGSGIVEGEMEVEGEGAAAAEVQPSVQSQNPPFENPSSIPGNPSPVTFEAIQAEELPPSDLTEEQLAVRMMDKLSFSGGQTDLRIWADTIKFKARDAPMSPAQAYIYILTKALAAKKRGEFTKPPTWWMKDGDFDKEPKGSKGDVFTKFRNAKRLIEGQHSTGKAASA
jgi:hypothetical protein